MTERNSARMQVSREGELVCKFVVCLGECVLEPWNVFLFVIIIFGGVCVLGLSNHRVIWKRIRFLELYECSHFFDSFL